MTYRTTLNDMMAHVVERAPDVLIWRTSNAAWPKWGNYGMPWNGFQDFVQSTTFVSRMNEVALSVVAPYGPELLDSFAMTYPRPDHMESGNGRGARMVHPGPLVVSEMTRLLVDILMRRLCPDVRAACQGAACPVD